MRRPDRSPALPLLPQDASGRPHNSDLTAREIAPSLRQLRKDIQAAYHSPATRRHSRVSQSCGAGTLVQPGASPQPDPFRDTGAASPGRGSCDTGQASRPVRSSQGQVPTTLVRQNPSPGSDRCRRSEPGTTRPEGGLKNGRRDNYPEKRRSSDPYLLRGTLCAMVLNVIKEQPHWV